MNHYLLISKLQHIGFSDFLLTSYLHDRFQFVEYGHYNSEMYTASLGVPQGSILGPLLFLICINDASNITNIFRYFVTLHQRMIA